jgi:hypothetical protein
MKTKYLLIVLMLVLVACSSSDPMVNLYRQYDRNQSLEMVCMDNEFCLGRPLYRDGIERLTVINVDRRLIVVTFYNVDEVKREIYNVTIYLAEGRVENRYTVPENKPDFFYDYINYEVIYGDAEDVNSTGLELRLIDNFLSITGTSLDEIYRHYDR